MKYEILSSKALKWGGFQFYERGDVNINLNGIYISAIKSK
jgi:hypothetical protein